MHLIYKVVNDVTIFITLAGTCTRISRINIFRFTMIYLFIYFFTLTLTLIIVPFLSWVLSIVPLLFPLFPTIKFTSTLTRDTFCKFSWFFYLFDHIKYFRVHAFCFNRKTYTTKWILYSIKAPITLVHTNDKWIVMKFIRVQISKYYWHDHA